MREVDLAAFRAAHRDGAVVIDVRQLFEYVMGHVPGAVLVPMNKLASRAAELPRGVPVYVICASGNRSLAAAAFRAAAGSVAWWCAGAPGAWSRAARPMVRGRRAAA